VTRVYNGVASYVPSVSDINHLSGQLGVGGDSVTTANLSFDNKNVAGGKTLSVNAATVSDGNGGNNYAVTLGSNFTSTITRLDSVTWVGGSTGNWFDPTNWAGGAVPDLSNVKNVVIPPGITVNFGNTVVLPAESGPVNIDGLTGAGGNLTQNAGELHIGTGGITLSTLRQSGGILTNAGPTNLDNFNQSGGSYTGTGNMTAGTYEQTGGTTVLVNDLTVTQDFSQGSAGTLTVGGNTNITQRGGGGSLGNLARKNGNQFGGTLTINGVLSSSGSDDASELMGRVMSTTLANNLAQIGVLVSTSPSPALAMPPGVGVNAPSSETASASNVNSDGITIDVRNAGLQNEAIMAAVSLPKGTSTSGTGFSFELPSNIRDLVQTPGNVQATLPNGAALPAWLKFIAQSLRFEAAAVPDGAFPLQVVMQLGTQRVLVVISERTE
jgi:hypothetical protein